MRHLLCAIALIASFAAFSPAFSRDWFDFNREEALSRMRAAVDAMEEIAPIPPLKCRPNPGGLRYCNAQVSRRLKLEVVTSLGIPTDHPEWKEKFTEFQKDEDAGRVYQITVSLADTDIRQSADMFDVLCVAAILSASPKTSIRAARRQYEASLRRSANMAATGDGLITVPGNPATFLIEITTSQSAYCTVSAEDDYRLPR